MEQKSFNEVLQRFREIEFHENFDMIVAFNGYKFIDYSKVTPEHYINCAIDCVQFANSDGFEQIILNGLSK